ncbi:MAG: hypothetical protein WAW52_03355 [Methanothrix sp.]
MQPIKRAASVPSSQGKSHLVKLAGIEHILIFGIHVSYSEFI